MKVLSKPLSSPSRAEKFPPPLMRFLRSNAGSRSRGRSRSSPMFYLRSRRSAIETTQEPSSPKVTCIGQVRVRRSSAKSTSAAAKRRRWWRNRALCFGKTTTSPNRKNPLGGMFCRCGSIFGWGYCKKVDSRDSFRVSSNSRGGKIEKFDAASNRDYANKCENFGNKRGLLESSSSSASSPPKNALMLTRCRSAPYRSSSLGGRFWGSPLSEKDDDDTVKNDGKSDELPATTIVEEKEEEKSCVNSAENVEEIKKIGGGAVHPLLLTRCKSGPARIGERLSAEAEAIVLLRQTRLAHDLVQQNS